MEMECPVVFDGIFDGTIDLVMREKVVLQFPDVDKLLEKLAGLLNVSITKKDFASLAVSLANDSM